MATQMQLRGGTTAENLLFTGAQREVTFDTDKNTIVAHDGVAAGGYPLATEKSLADNTFYYNDDVLAGSAANAYILVPKPNTSAPNAYLDGIQFGFVTASPNTGPATANFQGLGVKSIKYPGGVDPAPGDVSGRVDLVFDETNDWLELQRKDSGSQPEIRSLSASITGNALTITLAPTKIDFRSPVLSSGATVTRAAATSVNLTIPVGATLGTQSGQQSQLAIVAIDNAGVIELAAINLAGAPTLNETGTISTAAVSGVSTSANTFYSTTGRANVPYRVVGLIESTQAAAGTWASPPTLIQGQGGQAIIGANRLSSLVTQNSTSGTSVDFVSLPASVRRITLLFNAVSTSGVSPVQVQIGTSSGVDTTGYSGGYIAAAGSAGAGVFSTGLGLLIGTEAAASTRHGQVVITAMAGGSWCMSGTLCRSDAAGGTIANCTKTLSGAIARIRVTTVSGTDTFDAGQISIILE